jgi:hypothetical protein
MRRLRAGNNRSPHTPVYSPAERRRVAEAKEAFRQRAATQAADADPPAPVSPVATLTPRQKLERAKEAFRREVVPREVVEGNETQIQRDPDSDPEPSWSSSFSHEVPRRHRTAKTLAPELDMGPAEYGMSEPRASPLRGAREYETGRPRVRPTQQWEEWPHTSTGPGSAWNTGNSRLADRQVSSDIERATRKGFQQTLKDTPRLDIDMTPLRKVRRRGGGTSDPRSHRQRRRRTRTRARRRVGQTSPREAATQRV